MNDLWNVDLERYNVRHLYKKFPQHIKDEFHQLITSESVFKDYDYLVFDTTDEELIISLELYSVLEDKQVLAILRSVSSDNEYDKILMNRFTDIMYDYLKIKDTLLDEYPEWLI